MGEFPTRVITEQPQQQGVGERLFALEAAMGFGAVAELSRARFVTKRRELQEEGGKADYSILLSNTTSMVHDVEGQDGYRAVDSGATSLEEQQVVDSINRNGSVTQIGTVTFGRKEGNSVLTVVTYCDFPVSPVAALADLPDLDGLVSHAITEGAPVEMGYIRPREVDGKYIYEKQPVLRSNDVTEMNAYATGLTSEVFDLVESAGRMDHLVSPLVQGHIADHPFNTLSYHALYRQEGSPPDKEAFYRQVVENDGAFYEANGGNCSLFSLGLARDLEKLQVDHRILLYPSWTNGTDKDGHSAVMLMDGQHRYLADPGLTLPWIIPIDERVPLFPFERVGDKDVLVQVNDVNTDNLPDVIMVSPKGLQQFKAQEAISVGEFRDRLPRILARLHDSRPEMKFDLHEALGQKRINLSINRNTGRITLNGGPEKKSLQVHAFLADEEGALTAFREKCGKNSVDAEAIIGEIRTVAEELP